VVPADLPRMMSDSDMCKTDRLMTALLKMKKVDLGALKQAYEQKA
jgi:predicted 3-demethylubiquinone-9 3-methyltransferase (glyoxalase superfamily)